MSDFIPSNDDAFAHMAATLTGVIVPEFATYGLSADQVAPLSAAMTAWSPAWTAWQAEQQNYLTLLADKDNTRAALEAQIRLVNNLVQANPAVTDADKASAGLPIHKTTRTPVAVPATHPVLYRVDNEHLLQRLWFSDQTTPGSKAKPAGVSLCEIRQSLVAAGGAAPADPNTMPLLAMDTKSPHRTDLDPTDVGQTAYYCQRWVNTRGDVGPWGMITSYVVS